MMFMPSPVFIMSQVLIFPAWASNTIALGGVETGNMKAQLQVKVAGNIQYRGLCCNRNMSEHTGVGMKMRESKSGKLIQLIRCCVSYLSAGPKRIVNPPSIFGHSEYYMLTHKRRKAYIEKKI